MLLDRLRNLLGRFYSKTAGDNALLSSQCSPDIDRRITNTAEGSYVAPCDGYVRVSGTASAADGEVFVQDEAANVRLLTMQANDTSNWIQTMIPVRKGRRYSIFPTESTASINGADFIPFVGEGG